MESFQEAARIFLEARGLSGEERNGLLDERCGADGELRAEVERLLAGDARELPVPALARDDREEIEQIGPYKCLERIGEGGFGVVYMAQQTEPVPRRVALKVLKPGMDSRRVLARFEAERQALALMDHPNITRVLDAGSTPLGRPYFVMELVRGMPITSFCDAGKLGPRERIELFLQVCAAVHHAHQKGIIHRDLKPGNVLVTLHDGEPVPKVIDFGIAKALHRPLTNLTLFTEFQQFLGTPVYMSPEQAEMSGLDIDTRTDVYSLGVLLYELLTGMTPFDPETLTRAGPQGFQQILREVDPPTPSRRLGTSSGDKGAHLRSTDSATLARQLRGDLDWIVMKCLEKNRARRYETVHALAHDLRRYLADEPVLARPPSAAYRFAKFARRHKALLVGASATLLALVVGLGLAAAGFVEARHERDRAMAAQDRATREMDHAMIEMRRGEALVDLLRDMLASAGPGRARDYTVAAMLDDFAMRLGDRLRDQPEVEARIRLTMGLAYIRLAEHDKAREQIERAGHVSRALPADRDLALSVKEHLGQLYRAEGRYQEAAEELHAVVAEYSERGGAPNPVALQARLTLVSVEEALGHLDEALRIGREALDLAQATGRSADAAWVRGDLSRVLAIKGDYEEAERLARAALASWQALAGPRSLMACRSLVDLGSVLNERGAWREAEPCHTEALELARSMLPAGHPMFGHILAGLGLIANMTGRTDEAESMLTEAREIYRRALGEDHPALVPVYVNLAGVYYNRRDLARSEDALRRALAIQRRVLDGAHPALAGTLNNLAMDLHDRGALEEAEAAFREALEILGRSSRGDQPAAARVLLNHAITLHAMGRLEDAEAQARAAVRIRRAEGRPDNIAGALDLLAMILIDSGRAAEAAPLLRESLELRRTKAPASLPRSSTRSLLGAALVELGQLDEAEPLLKENLAAFEADPGVPRSQVAAVRERLARLRDAQGRADEAAGLRSH